MIEAVIFDMDGLLIDSEPYWDKARSIMAAEVGKEWNTDDHKAIMGVSTAEWVAYMINRLDLAMPPQAVEEHIIAQMEALYERRIPYLPGAEAAVAMAAANFPTGLASGSPRRLIDAVIADEALKGRFKAIVSGDQVAHGKPSPDIYLKTAHEMDVKLEYCVCLEDSGNGIAAGKNAGMKVIAVPDSRFAPDPHRVGQADVVLESLTELALDTIHGLG
jgi:HAD superfamily hydrolase (TIGR01509 family)